MNEPEDPTHPHHINAEAEELPRKIALVDYRPGMISMRQKGYSFQDIADWLSEKLGQKITRHQISYVVSNDPRIQEFENSQEDLEDHIEENTGQQL